MTYPFEDLPTIFQNIKASQAAMANSYGFDGQYSSYVQRGWDEANLRHTYWADRLNEYSASQERGVPASGLGEEQPAKGPLPEEKTTDFRVFSGFSLAVFTQGFVSSMRSLDGFAFRAERGAAFVDGARGWGRVGQAICAASAGGGWVGVAAQAQAARSIDLQNCASDMAWADEHMRRQLNDHYTQLEIACRLYEAYMAVLGGVIGLTASLDSTGQHAASWITALVACVPVLAETGAHQAALVAHSATTASKIKDATDRYLKVAASAHSSTRRTTAGPGAHASVDPTNKTVVAVGEPDLPGAATSPQTQTSPTPTFQPSSAADPPAAGRAATTPQRSSGPPTTPPPAENRSNEVIRPWSSPQSLSSDHPATATSRTPLPAAGGRKDVRSSPATVPHTIKPPPLTATPPTHSSHIDTTTGTSAALTGQRAPIGTTGTNEINIDDDKQPTTAANHDQYSRL